MWWTVVRSAILAAGAVLWCVLPARAQDPARTATIWVHGFERSGADRHGTFGVDVRDSLVDSVATLAGLPVADGAPALPPSAVAATTYYGDTPPPHYTPADVAELDHISAQWGGGVPRYALIVAKYARDVMRRTGASQVNFVSASFGSLIVRWLIEKDVGGLAGTGRIARWLTIEGLLAGNWAASRTELRARIEPFVPLPVDVDHMAYDWVSAHLHSPRTEADHPNYAGILIGQVVSSDDDYNSGALTILMRNYSEWQPNDGVQAVADARFQSMTARSRLAGLPPMLAYSRTDHFSIQQSRGAWAMAASFLMQRRRVTVTLTSARVANLREPQSWYWDWRPAEVVLQSRAYSPAVAARWGIPDPLTVREKEGAVAPMRLYSKNGETQALSYVLFDQLVLAEETQLQLQLRAEEVDYDQRYGVLETVQTPYYDDLGSALVLVSTREPGTYSFQAADWSGTLSVGVFDYPFGAPVGVTDGAQVARPTFLRASPNPHASLVRIQIEGLAPSDLAERATLEILDLSGRSVRRIEGDLRAGFSWDGRDEAGRSLPAGVYLHRVVTPRGTWTGRSVRIE